MNKKISIGDKFSNWTVLSEAPSHKSKGGTTRKMYTCQCVCGKIKDVAATALRTGHSKSCGCRGSYLKENEQYQEWTVLKKSNYTNSHNNQFYTCKCSCGVIRNVRMCDLLNGNSKNCGHSRYKLSQGAQNIKDLLIKNNIAFYQEYIFQTLPNRRFDFAIYDINNPSRIVRLVEYDGEQHNINSKSSWHTTELVQRDIEKNNFALNNKIPLVRIPYYKISFNYEDIFGDKYLVEG